MFEVAYPFLVEAPARAIGVVVVDGSDTRFHVFGSRRTTDAVPFDPDTTFEIGSVSKVFAALLVVDAERRGELKLDDSIAAHLHDWELPSRDGKAMTLRQAAAHTTGLPIMPDNWIRTDPVLHITRYTAAMFRENLASHALATTPGAKYVYSNQGTALLGLVLERHSGSKYSALLHSRVFDPLGMNRSGYADRVARIDDNVLAGYEEDERLSAPRLDVSPLGPCCVIRSTLRDMGRFAAAALDARGPFAASFARMSDRQVPLDPAEPEGRWSALGWVTDPTRGVLRKNGQVSGYRTDLVISAAGSRGFFVVINSQRSDISKLSNALIDVILPRADAAERE